MFTVEKRISGFSTCFRQWRAEGHCHLLHGYSLQFVLSFGCDTLDDKNWVVDFGSFGELKQKLNEIFDHTCVVAEDDPNLEVFRRLHEMDVLNLVEMPNVGCEMFAELVFDLANDNLGTDEDADRNVRILSVKCIENENNSSTYWPIQPSSTDND